MGDEFYWEIYEMFEEQLQSQIPPSKQLVEDLKDKRKVSNALEELFRLYHTYKATSSFLSLTPMNKLVTYVETILGPLREANSVVHDSIISWLSEVSEQMLLYSDQMSLKNKVLTEAPQSLFEAVNIEESSKNPQEVLKTLSLLYIGEKDLKVKKHLKFLEKKLKNVRYCNVLKLANELKNLSHFDIVVVDIGPKNHKVIKLIQSYHTNLPIISIFNKISNATTEKLLKNGITNAIAAPVYNEKLESELLSVVKVFFSGSQIIIDYTKISSFISDLKPLSDTIFKIMDMCDETETSVKELIPIVKKDPIITAKILKLANSPIYGSSEIRTIDQAVAKFGKMLIKTFSLGTVSNSFMPINLSAYGISEEDFSTASIIRTSLMIKWYSKVSISDLSILSSVAFLTSMGQLLISKEIAFLDATEKFQKLAKEVSVQYAEESLLKTNTSRVSSQVLKLLKLSPEIVTIIEHTDLPEGAPNELKKLAAANHIVNALVSEKGEVLTEIPPSLHKMLAIYNFDEKILLRAISTFRL